ncbi:DUF6059 family protein [Streptomyces sp. NPDC059072]|uniref:DUF6059 family protein n=1 Tax=unclassified Streptomyces TaxID=2593676 RepID=UPI0036C67F6F
MFSYVLRCLKALGEWIIAAGLIWIPPVPPPASPHLSEPPPGHPERLDPTGPLTELELLLSKDLPGWP